MKNKRQAAIVSIIEEKPIKTHEQLVAELGEHGFCVTQATVSRDVRELSLIKNPEGVYCVSETLGAKPRDSFSDYVKSIDFAGNLVVVKTKPGTAQAVAAFADEITGDTVLGSIAGDDTVFFAVKDMSKTEEVCKRLRTFLSVD